MKFDPLNKTEDAKNVILLLADINGRMMAIRQTLAARTAVVSATRGCDIRLYRDSCGFESYVEAEISTGAMFNWSLDIMLTSNGWIFQRRVAKQTKDGEDVEIEFADCLFPDFGNLTESYLVLMTQFEETASTFDFNIST